MKVRRVVVPGISPRPGSCNGASNYVYLPDVFRPINLYLASPSLAQAPVVYRSTEPATGSVSGQPKPRRTPQPCITNRGIQTGWPLILHATRGGVSCPSPWRQPTSSKGSWPAKAGVPVFYRTLFVADGPSATDAVSCQKATLREFMGSTGIYPVQ